MSAELNTIFPPRQTAGPSRSGARSNVSLLTEGAGYIKRAKKTKKDELEKILFDDDKRKDFLTGFRKRKQAKLEERRTRAKKRDHEEHLAERREARRDLKRRAEENVRQVRLAMGLPADPEGDGDEEEYTGPAEMKPVADSDDSDDSDEEVDEAEEYEDDDTHAVVTIQDDFEDELMGVRKKRKVVDGEGESKPAKPSVPLLPASSRKQTKKRMNASKLPLNKTVSSTEFPTEPAKTNLKHISKDYRSFETKAERRKMREMEKARRKEKWDIAAERRAPGGASGAGRGGRGGSAGRGGSSSRGRGGSTASTRGAKSKGKKTSKKAQWGAI